MQLRPDWMPSEVLFLVSPLTTRATSYQNDSVAKMSMKYLLGYPESLRAQVQQLIAQDRLGDMLLKKYPQAHGVRTDRALYDYVMALKNEIGRAHV